MNSIKTGFKKKVINDHKLNSADRYITKEISQPSTSHIIISRVPGIFSWQVKKYCIWTAFFSAKTAIFSPLRSHYALRACIVLLADSYQVTFTVFEYIPLLTLLEDGRTLRVRYRLDYVRKEAFLDPVGKWDKNKSGGRKQEAQAADNNKPSFKSWDDRGSGDPGMPRQKSVLKIRFSHEKKGLKCI